jgi:hypothetical protein
VYNSVVKTRTFDTSSSNDLKDYDWVLNNPLCSIIEAITEKISDRSIGGEGEPTIINDRIVRIVSWKEKVLL